jgi:hypothetical protein
MELGGFGPKIEPGVSMYKTVMMSPELHAESVAENNVGH